MKCNMFGWLCLFIWRLVKVGQSAVYCNGKDFNLTISAVIELITKNETYTIENANRVESGQTNLFASGFFGSSGEVSLTGESHVIITLDFDYNDPHYHYGSQYDGLDNFMMDAGEWYTTGSSSSGIDLIILGNYTVKATFDNTYIKYNDYYVDGTYDNGTSATMIVMNPSAVAWRISGSGSSSATLSYAYYDFELPSQYSLNFIRLTKLIIDANWQEDNSAYTIPSNKHGIQDLGNLSLTCHDLNKTKTDSPTFIPSNMPSKNPSTEPSANPSNHPSDNPSEEPSRAPTNEPSTYAPSVVPSMYPSFMPSFSPTTAPAVSTPNASSQVITVEDVNDYAIYFVGFLICVSIVILFVALIHDKFTNKSLSSSNTKPLNVLRFIQAFADLWTDVLFVIVLGFEKENNTDTTKTIMLILSIIFVILPYIMSCIACIVCVLEWKTSVESGASVRLTPYLNQYEMIIYCLTVAGGSFYSIIDLLSSKIFYLNVFNLQLKNSEKKRLNNFRFLNNVLFENIPQFIIQLWYLMINNDSNTNAIVYISITLSVTSIIIASLSKIGSFLQSMHNKAHKFGSEIEIKGMIKVKSNELKACHAFYHNKIAQCLYDILNTSPDANEWKMRSDVEYSIEVYYIQSYIKSFSEFEAYFLISMLTLMDNNEHGNGNKYNNTSNKMKFNIEQINDKTSLNGIKFRQALQSKSGLRLVSLPQSVTVKDVNIVTQMLERVHLQKTEKRLLSSMKLFEKLDNSKKETLGSGHDVDGTGDESNAIALAKMASLGNNMTSGNGTGNELQVATERGGQSTNDISLQEEEDSIENENGNGNELEYGTVNETLFTNNGKQDGEQEGMGMGMGMVMQQSASIQIDNMPSVPDVQLMDDHHDHQSEGATNITALIDGNDNENENENENEPSRASKQSGSELYNHKTEQNAQDAQNAHDNTSQ